MLLTSKLDKNQPIAYICSPRIGDSLFSMVTVNNLVRNGYRVTVYSDVLYQLRDFFSWATILPAITLATQRKLAEYPTVLHMYASELATELKKWHANSVVLSDSKIYLEPISMADIQAKVSQQELFLSDVVRVNNIYLPTQLTQRKFANRVIIQPTSFQAFKSWPRAKFISLAERLQAHKFEPVFIVAPHEYAEWQQVVGVRFDLQCFAALDALAYFIYEAAWFVGNDSGIGHLASNLGIPTLTLFIRPGLVRQWRPAWSSGHIVVPPWWLLTRPLREKFWGQCTSINRVWREFVRLVDGMKLKMKN